MIYIFIRGVNREIYLFFQEIRKGLKRDGPFVRRVLRGKKAA
jgi:hypothetical protein